MISIFKKIIFLTCYLLCFIFLAAQQTITLELHFVNKAGDKIISPDSSYTNAYGENYSISNFKYYISNIKLKNTNQKKELTQRNSYYLINEADDSSKTILWQVSVNEYDQLEFLIGVDSIANTSGAQDGALDPMNGMFWTWNTGYVSAKLEGRSSSSSLPNHLFEYHIGGYQKENNTSRTINLPLKNNWSGIKKYRITIGADVNTWFSAIHQLKISDAASCTTPGKLAVQFADNYSRMFSIESIEVL